METLHVLYARDSRQFLSAFYALVDFWDDHVVIPSGFS